MSGSQRVSILVPCHNGARYLRECLDSLLAQSHAPIEILVIDDASTDGTPDILASYGERLRVERNPRRLGQFATVNRGIGLVRGELLAIYHADDVYLENIVAREVEVFERHPDVAAVFCLDIFVDADGREYGRLELPPGIRAGGRLEWDEVLETLLRYRNTFLVGPTAMLRTELLRRTGGFRPERHGELADFDMWLTIARRHPIAIVPEHLMRYRHFHTNVTAAYRRARTCPYGDFAMLDACLGEGGRERVSETALRAFEAHRAEDWLMVAVNAYVAGEPRTVRHAVAEVRPGALLGSAVVQRGRLLVLYLALLGLSRLPRLGPIARLFAYRWHRPGPGRGRGPRWLREGAS